MAAPLVFVVAEPDVHRGLRAAEGLTVWADRFPTCEAFRAARARDELPLDLRPLVVVVSDALADGPGPLAELLAELGDVAVLVHDPAAPPVATLPGVARPARPAELRAAVWDRAGRRPSVADGDQPPGPVGDVGDAPTDRVRVADRSFAGHLVAVTAEGPASATSSAVAFALGARLALHGDQEVCVVGLHDDGGVLEALVTARRPTLVELLRDGPPLDDPEALLAVQVRDNATRVRVLLPGRALSLDHLDADDVVRLLTGLRARADLVVADLPASAATTTVGRATLADAEAVAVVTDGDADRTARDPGAARFLTVRTWDAEGVSRPSAWLSPDDDPPAAVLPTGRREGLGHEGLRYVTGGEDVERTLDAAVAMLVPSLARAPAPAVEAEFWRRGGIARRRRARR